MIRLAHDLLGGARSALLAALLLRPDEELHVRELARMARMSAGTIHRELRSLAELGLLTRREVGRQVFYRANRMHPVFADLSGLMRKTAGLPDELRTALAPLRDRIKLAFLFGGMVSGDAAAGSEVETLVVGDLTAPQVARAFEPAKQALGRKISAIVMKPDEFDAKHRENDDVLRQILEGPKLVLIGATAPAADVDQDRVARRPASSAELARELRNIRRNLEAPLPETPDK